MIKWIGLIGILASDLKFAAQARHHKIDLNVYLYLKETFFSKSECTLSNH